MFSSLKKLFKTKKSRKSILIDHPNWKQDGDDISIDSAYSDDDEVYRKSVSSIQPHLTFVSLLQHFHG